MCLKTSSLQWDLIEKMINALAPFEEMTRQVSSSDALASDIIPAVTVLQRLLLKQMDEDHRIKTMKSTSLDALQRRFSNMEQNPLYCIASLLDLRHCQAGTRNVDTGVAKKLWERQPHLRHTAHQLIKDHKSCAETGQELMRPYLHEFLTSAYEDYDIVIWSATSMKWIDAKIKELGVMDNPNYKITFMLDSAAMITVHTPKRGVVEVKPLGVIWGKYSEFYNRKNTIMFDDIGRNFLMNPQNGLKIRPFMKAHLNREKDKELHKLSLYLKEIAKLDDFSGLNHKHWERYLSKKQNQ
uniref:FCP1 homology domain-containing protein n=1 Tax=Cyprinus carpio carpio TaxID=630221 RepID=A0A8C1CSZ4_CYPCA